MQACLDKNFDIGVITAGGSSYTMGLCNSSTPPIWMPDVLCRRLKDTGGKLFNNVNSLFMILAGERMITPPDKFPTGTGQKKGFAMQYSRNKFHSKIPDECLLLFDDDTGYLAGVKEYNKDLHAECSGSNCSQNTIQLNTAIINNALSKLVLENGCK